MRKLVGQVTALGRFISKLGERALPFFKLMKKKGPFEWTPEADRAFQDLRRYLTCPLVMVAPRPLEPLVLYLAATPHSASAALVAVQEEHQDKGASRQATLPAGATQDQEGATRAATATAEDASFISTPTLVEHPVYFVSTGLWDARARYCWKYALEAIIN